MTDCCQWHLPNGCWYDACCDECPEVKRVIQVPVLTAEESADSFAYKEDTFAVWQDSAS